MSSNKGRWLHYTNEASKHHSHGQRHQCCPGSGGGGGGSGAPGAQGPQGPPGDANALFGNEIVPFSSGAGALEGPGDFAYFAYSPESPTTEAVGTGFVMNRAGELRALHVVVEGWSVQQQGFVAVVVLRGNAILATPFLVTFLTLATEYAFFDGTPFPLLPGDTVALRVQNAGTSTPSWTAISAGATSMNSPISSCAPGFRSPSSPATAQSRSRPVIATGRCSPSRSVPRSCAASSAG